MKRVKYGSFDHSEKWKNYEEVDRLCNDYFKSLPTISGIEIHQSCGHSLLKFRGVQKLFNIIIV